VRAGRCDPFTIGHHFTLRPIHDGHPSMIDINVNLDVATFTILDPDRVTSMQGGSYDTPPTVRPLGETMRVEKVGRTTGHTHGTVVGASVASVSVYYDVRELWCEETRLLSWRESFHRKGRQRCVFL
jgi:hypothetical protein